jgi:2-polyprenyl-6-hydroxyphenyl methylase/3-demethylubiquinone-9 3-methyltransferase
MLRAEIDNDVYKQPGDIWWDPEQPMNLLQTVVNPGRVGFFAAKARELGLGAGQSALEVGCGGGILCEEIARMGFHTTGVDPSPAALAVAAAHAKKSGLTIDYREGFGEKLPFPAASFEVVFCCDVLEHVSDLNQVVSEIARVLKPGGTFFYDTINRTPVSKLVAIKIWQHWKAFAFMPRNLHVWEMFIKPRELHAVMECYGLANLETHGLAPAVNPFTMLYYLRQRAKGRLPMSELGRKISLRQSRDKSMLYMGVAQKKS